MSVALTWLVYLAVIVVLLYFLGVSNHNYFAKLGIPFAKPLPWIGNMAPFVFKQNSLLDMLVDLYNKFPDSKICGIFEFRNPVVLIRDPDIIKQIGVKDFDHFLDHRVKIDEVIEPMFGRNLFSLQGQKWRDMRATLSPAFTGSKMRSMFGLVTECAEDLVKYLETLNESERTLELKDLYTRFTNDVIASSAFGLKVDSLKNKDNDFYLMTKEISNFGGLRAFKFFGYTSFPRLMKLFKVQMFGPEIQQFYRGLVQDTMKMRDRENITRPDMIQLLMQVRKGTLKHEDTPDVKDAGFATVTESTVGKATNNRIWEDDDLAAQAVLFLVAGFDTSSTLMCFTCYELAINPDVQKKLQDEIDEVRAENKKVTYDIIQKMKYLDMVISEGLRYWTPAGFMDRICVKPYTLIDPDTNARIELKPGDGVWFGAAGIHRDPKYYPNPTKFDPERFSDENKQNIKPFTYLPFGVGPRSCIGSRFALMEAKALLFFILSSFTIEPCAKTQIPIKLSAQSGNVTAEKGFWVYFRPRKATN
ncbi:cytochrome P450 9e2-like [Ctenocephalides felis]|uniref:cytochrome P450 9e2-like n=1 Tax=Ctenocephalides felis TaxID=7515 RepID=UPI000E6E3620|nr:cytochrome P450 9e2-like [Ctenocephalides felis]